MKKRNMLAGLLIAMMSVVVLAACEPEKTNKPPAPEFGVEELLDPIEGMTLTWRDEFGGSRLDPSKWAHQVGGFWSNNEIQYYDEDGVSVYDGTLKITAHKDPKTFERDGKETVRDYGSSRIRTQDKFSQTYGRFEAKIKLPAVSAMWPAFWMMPEKAVYGGWPRSGEIDIMESKGRLPDFVGNALHYNGDPAQYSSMHHTMTNGFTIEDYHIYRVDWREDLFEWYIDGIKTFEVGINTWKTAAVPKSENPLAPFDEDFYMILNLAVGGNYDGGRVPSADFEEASMEVDYVRVWQWNEWL